MPKLSDLIDQTKFGKGLDMPSGNPFGRWAQGVAQRTMHPLETLAGAAQNSIDNPMETALDWSVPMSGSLSGIVGMFAGKGAKTANLAQLLKAEKLKAKGVPDELIWKKTGWTLDTPDKIPRFEIPDNAASYKGQMPSWQRLDNELPIQESYSHGDLYSAYPDAASIKLKPVSANSGLQGSYDEAGNAIAVNGVLPRNSASSAKQHKQWQTNAQSTTLHELQHAIQQREGFARGGSPSQDIVEMTPEYQAWARSHASLPMSPSGDAVNRSMALYDEIPDKLKAYQRLAGEAEARLTQARMNMTPEQRLAQYPYQPDYFQKETGVPLKDLIVRRDGGTAMSAKTISPFDGERRLYALRQQNGKWKPVYSDGSPIEISPEFNDGGAAANWLRNNKDKFQQVSQ